MKVGGCNNKSRSWLNALVSLDLKLNERLGVSVFIPSVSVLITVETEVTVSGTVCVCVETTVTGFPVSVVVTYVGAVRVVVTHADVLTVLVEVASDVNIEVEILVAVEIAVVTEVEVWIFVTVVVTASGCFCWLGNATALVRESMDRKAKLKSDCGPIMITTV